MMSSIRLCSALLKRRLGLHAHLAQLMLAMQILALAAFAQVPARTPNPAALTGLVLDPTRAIISGAKVQLLHRDETVVSSATTDGIGRFQLSLPSPGDYRL